jgi:hypothetical protein
MYSVEKIIQNAKNDFERYAKEKDLKVKKDPFAIDLVHVEIIKGERSYLLDREVPLSQLSNVPKYLKEVDLEAFELLFKDEYEQFTVKINDLDEITSVIEHNKNQLFDKFGKVSVQFFRDRNELFKVDVNNLKDLINIIKDNEDKFGRTKGAIKRQKFERFYTTDSGDGAGVVLVGNVIIDEFQNIIADEQGNCLSFE